MKNITYLLLILFFSCSEEKNKPISQQYEEYIPINEKTIHFGNHEMSLKFTSHQPIELSILDNYNLLVKTKKENDLSELSIVNTNGEIVRKHTHQDSYTNGKEQFIKGYLVNFEKKYFKTWAFDEIQDEKKIIQENELLNYSTDKASEQIENIYKTAEFITVDYDHDYKYLEQKKVEEDTDTSNRKLAVIYIKPTVYIINYLKQNTWYQFYTTNNIMKKISLDDVLSSGVNSLFEKYNSEEKEWEVIPNENIKYQYFYKIKKTKIVKPSGGNSPAYKAKWWLGNLYLKVNIDKDTLKIYDKLYLDEEWLHTSIEINGKKVGTFYDINKNPIKPFMLYHNNNLNYHLFTNDINKLYFIQKKNNY